MAKTAKKRNAKDLTGRNEKHLEREIARVDRKVDRLIAKLPEMLRAALRRRTAGSDWHA